MQKVVIVKSEKGYTVAEVSNYTYTSEAVARAFARDKWGDESPAVAVEALSGSLKDVISSVPHAKDKRWLENDPAAEFSYNMHQLLKQGPPCLPDCLRCRLEKAST